MPKNIYAARPRKKRVKTLAGQTEREKEFKSKIRKAIIYPAMIICLLIGVGLAVLIIVAPQLIAISQEVGIELPPATKLVISLGMFLIGKWHLVVLIILGFAALLWATLRIKRARRLTDSIVLKIPLISEIVKKTNSAYLTRTLGSLIVAGVPLDKSLKMVSADLRNSCFRQALEKAAEKVKKGEKLSKALRDEQNLFPLLMFQMIEMGEQNGEMPAVLAELADFFEDKAIGAVQNLTTMMEPVLMLIIGGAVGFFAVSTIQPMYSLLKVIR